MKQLFVFILLFAFTAANAQDSTRHIPISAAIKSNLVKVEATGLGGFCGKVLNLSITNNSTNKLTIDVDAGTLFQAQDEAYQNLLCLGGESLTLNAGEKKDTTVQTYCANLTRHAPTKGLKFTFWKKADSSLTGMLKFARKNKIPHPLIQYGTWCYTDNNCVNTVYHHDYYVQSKQLSGYIAKNKKIADPKYYVENKLEGRAGGPPVNAKNAKIVLLFTWGYEGYRHMYLVIRKADGSVYRKIESGWEMNNDEISATIEFDPNKDPAGSYTVQLYDENHHVKQERKIFISKDPWEMYRHQND